MILPERVKKESLYRLDISNSDVARDWKRLDFDKYSCIDFGFYDENGGYCDVTASPRISSEAAKLLLLHMENRDFIDLNFQSLKETEDGISLITGIVRHEHFLYQRLNIVGISIGEKI